MHDHHPRAETIVPHREQAAAHRIEMSEKQALRSLHPLKAAKIGETKQADRHRLHQELIA